jgi:hypothetical protein
LISPMEKGKRKAVLFLNSSRRYRLYFPSPMVQRDVRCARRPSK